MERCDGAGGDQIAAPDQGGGPSTSFDRPHLIERQANVITATGIVERISGLKRSVGARTTIGSAKGKNALFVRSIFILNIKWKVRRG